MKGYLLDTNIIIDFLKGDQKTVSILKKIKDKPLFISVLTISEYYYGALRTKNTELQLSAFHSFIDKGKITTLPIEETIAQLFGKLQAALGKKGQLKPVFDLFIAATCLIHKLVLVTFNIKDFREIEKLKIYDKV